MIQLLAQAAMLCALLLYAPALAHAQSGVLIPSTRKSPTRRANADEMTVEVVIDNQFARVRGLIFGNRTERIQQGR